MQINFNNDYTIRTQSTIVNSTESQRTKSEAATMTSGSGLLVSIGQNLPLANAYDKESDGKATDFETQLGATDVQLKQDYMSVMSLSMSDKDYAEMVRTGQPPEDMDVTDSVTILDDIKAALIKGGTQIAGYTDDIDKAALQEITGSIAMANELLSSMSSQDVPVTEENIDSATLAIKQAQSALPLSDNATEYLLANKLRPTIANVYQASHVQTMNMTGKNNISRTDMEALSSQIEETVRESGLTGYEQALADAKWLVERGLPLTPETLNELNQLSELREGITQKQITNAVSIALGAGIPASKANLTYEESIYTQAENLVDRFASISEDSVDAAVSAGVTLNLRNLENVQSISVQDVTDMDSGSLHARQVMEEVRIFMTVEANRMLLRSNFQIDITPMEELVDALKMAQQAINNRLFPANDEQITNTRADLYIQAKNELYTIPSLPAAVIAEDDVFSLHQVYESGVSRRDMYIKAGESYEAIMTAPRSDMGDSILKAFRNVDDILQDMDMELSDDNRRAVRILGYNTMEITPEAVEQIKETDLNLRRTLEKLTPSKVLTMIREDKNPLEMTFTELNYYLDSKEQSSKDTAAEYAKFLMQLERHGDITPEERESYIGIYRLIRKINKTDDAAVGRLSEMDAEMSFANLLSAIRSKSRGGMDYTIDDDFAGADIVRKTASIDDQINTAFVIENLISTDTSVSLSNIEAMNALKNKRGDWFKPIANEYLKGLVVKNPEDEADEVLGDYVDSLTLYDGYNKMLDGHMEKLSDMLSTADTYVDVKAIHSSMTQLSILSSLAKDETYDIPAIIDGEATAIRLTVKHESGAGQLAISLCTEILGKIAAEFSFTGETSGYIAYESDKAGQRLRGIMDILAKDLGFEPELIHAGKIDLTKYTDGFDMKKTNSGKEKEDSTDINNTELYQIAKRFIGVVRTI